MAKLNKGFTLIELIVVVFIVGLLATAAVMTYSKSQSRARDSRRATDLSAIKDALKMYYQQHYFYPHELDQCSVSGGVDIDSSNCDGRGDWLGDSGQYLDVYNELVLNGFLKFLPKDPLNDLNYEYLYEPFGVVVDACTNIDCAYVLVGARTELPKNGGTGLCFTDKETLDNYWTAWCDNL